MELCGSKKMRTVTSMSEQASRSGANHAETLKIASLSGCQAQQGQASKGMRFPNVPNKIKPSIDEASKLSLSDQLQLVSLFVTLKTLLLLVTDENYTHEQSSNRRHNRCRIGLTGPSHVSAHAVAPQPCLSVFASVISQERQALLFHGLPFCRQSRCLYNLIVPTTRPRDQEEPALLPGFR